MTSKKQLIDEIFEICDSILEKAYKNQQCLQILIQKYPLNEGIQSFQLVPVSQYEDQSRNQLKQLTIEQLAYLLEDAQHTLDQVMYEELQINKLGLRMPKKSLLVQNYENGISCYNGLNQIIWKAQQQMFKAQQIIFKLSCKDRNKNLMIKMISRRNTKRHQKNRIFGNVIRIGDKQNHKLGNHNLRKYIEYKKSNESVQTTKRDKIELMDELEKKLQDLETEKEKMSSYSMDAFSKLLQTKQY